MSDHFLAPARSGLRDFGKIWGQMLLVSLATRVAVTFLVLPVLAWLLRLFMSSTGRGALRDEEILNFALSVPGAIAILLVGGFWIGAAFVEQSALMTIGFGAADGRRVSWFSALRFVASKWHSIFPLGSQLLGRVLVIVTPFGVAAWLVFSRFLTKHDINYYLQQRPPEFYWAGGFILLLLGVLAVILVQKVAGWLLALPAVLFEDLRPIAAIKDSKSASHGHRKELVGWLLAWLVLGGLASLAVTWLISSLGRSGVTLAGESIRMIAFTIGVVGVLTLAANALVSIGAAALFALVAVRVYRKYSGPGALPERLADGGELLSRTGARIPRKWLLGAAAAVILLALGATWLILSRVKMEDEVLIIAHRGSAATAPENTLASVRDAVAAGADFVEIDVQETADGEVVVFHDADFMKTAGDAIKIWEAGRADLERIDIGSWFDTKFSSERTPTLEQVLLECKGRSKVNIELKYYGHDDDLEGKVIELVERHGMADQVVVMSLKYDKVQKAKAKRPDWTYGLLTTVQLGDISNFDVDFLGVSAAGASRGFVRHAKSKGFDVYVWTVNDPIQMSSMISRGVDGIITDDPALAKRTLEFRASLNPIQRLLIGIGTEVGVFSLPTKLPSGEDA